MTKVPENLLPALRQYQHNDCSGLLAGFDYDETIATVNALNSEIERLNALVAMQTEAIGNYFVVYANKDKEPHWCNRMFDAREAVNQSISASSETVAAWTKERDAKVLESASLRIRALEGNACNSGFASMYDAALLLERDVSEIRASIKGE